MTKPAAAFIRNILWNAAIPAFNGAYKRGTGCAVFLRYFLMPALRVSIGVIPSADA